MSEKLKRIFLQAGNLDDTTWCQDKVNDDDVEYVLATESVNVIDRFMSPSEVCRKYQVQNCHVCDRADCGDNTNPIVKQNKEMQSQLAILEAANKDLRFRLECEEAATAVVDSRLQEKVQELAVLSAQLEAVGKWQSLNEKLVHPMEVHEWQELDSILAPVPKALDTIEVSVCEKCHAVNPSDFDLNLNGSRIPTHEGDYEQCGGVLVTRLAVIIQKGGSHD